MPNTGIVQTLKNMRWRTIVQVGLFVALLSHLLLLVMLGSYLVLFWIFQATGIDALALTNGVQLSSGISALFELSAFFFSQVATWGLPALIMLVTASAAARVAHSVERSARLYGALVGLIAALTGLMVNTVADLPYGGGLTLYSGTLFLLTVVAGWSGGVPVHLEKAKADAVYRSSRALQDANSLQAIVRAIGENMASPDVNGVALWQASPGEDGVQFSLMADWVRRVPVRWPVTMCLSNESGETAEWVLGTESRPVLLQGRRLPQPSGVPWRELGMNALLFMPVDNGFASAAVEHADTLFLVIAAESPQAFSEERLRQYMMLDAQVALMLENLRLVEQARQAGVFAERQRLAHEIHDTLAQGFTSIVMHAEAAEQLITENEGMRLSHHVAMIQQAARENLSQARRLVWALRPKSLERASLSQAVYRTVQRWSESSGVEATAMVTGDVYALHPTAEIVVLRAVQEALNNVSKHARARNVTVTLSFTKSALLVDVQDDGQGFDLHTIQEREGGPDAGGYGLAGLAERLHQIGGSLTVESEPGRGTTIAAIVPVASPKPSVNAVFAMTPAVGHAMAAVYRNGNGEYAYESN